MKLTKNFNKSEFDCQDGSEMPIDVLDNIRITAENLQVLRDYIEEPININSAYRSVQHNKRIGGTPKSQHVKGLAVDIRVNGYTTKKLYKLINKLIHNGTLKKGGLGLYKGFVHYDIRGYNARWDNF